MHPMCPLRALATVAVPVAPSQPPPFVGRVAPCTCYESAEHVATDAVDLFVPVLGVVPYKVRPSTWFAPLSELVPMTPSRVLLPHTAGSDGVGDAHEAPPFVAMQAAVATALAQGVEAANASPYWLIDPVTLARPGSGKAESLTKMLAASAADFVASRSLMHPDYMHFVSIRR